MLYFAWLRILFFFLLLPYYLLSFPSFLYLTWTQDPTRSMTVCWHSEEKGGDLLLYRKTTEEIWLKKTGVLQTPETLEFSLYTIDLNSLEPDTDYDLYLPAWRSCYRFRTLPDILTEEKELRFAIGGDVYRSFSLMRNILVEMEKCDPDFVVLAGDLVYCNAPLFKARCLSQKWARFLSYWHEEMRRPDGTLIPLIVTLGNHDINRKGCPLFTLFPLLQKKQSYANFKVGNFLSLFLLDTGHQNPVAGAQTEWLKTNLEKEKEIPYKIAIYHVAAYPSVYDFYGPVPKSVRLNWVPLFESYGLQCAFEHHNHAYKRTYPLRNNQISPDGILYCGDGCVGVPPRPTRAPKPWYLARAESLPCFWLTTLRPDELILESRTFWERRVEGLCLPKTHASP
jgi:acid phosphatase type 7